MSEEYVEINYDDLKIDGAISWGVVINNDVVWFPKSLCEIDEDNNVIIVPRWIAFEEGLI